MSIETPAGKTVRVAPQSVTFESLKDLARLRQANADEKNQPITATNFGELARLLESLEQRVAVTYASRELPRWRCT